MVLADLPNLPDLTKLSDSQLRALAKELDEKAGVFKTTQWAIKIKVNSVYGALGNEHCLYCDIRLAEAVTYSGQFVIQKIEKAINQYLNKLLKTGDYDYVIAIDTDSVHLRLEKVVEIAYKNKDASDKKKVVKFLDKFCNEKLQPVIEKCCQEMVDLLNAVPGKIVMKREDISDRGIWRAKKNYVKNVWNKDGIQYDKPKLKFVGLEIVKSSTPDVCREKLTEAMNILMNQTEADMRKFVAGFKKEFFQLPAEEIGFPKPANGLTKYAYKGKQQQDADDKIFIGKTPPQTKGALIYNYHIRKHKLEALYPLTFEGDKIKFVYLNLPNPLKSRVIGFPEVLPAEFKVAKHIDYERQFDTAFLQPLDTILSLVSWRSKKVNNLMDFLE